jgi:hypothetical protein
LNKKNLFIITLITTVILYAVYGLSKWILKLNKLAYMNMVNFAFCAIIVLLVLIIIIQILIALFNITKVKNIKLTLRIASGIGIALIVCATIVISLYGVLFSIFIIKPEHIVEKNGKKMVAYVHSFLQVYVDYYDYKNAIVRGTQIRINEDYGNGGYDPFEREKMPTIQRYIYYDKDGNMTESNWIPLD